ATTRTFEPCASYLPHSPVADQSAENFVRFGAVTRTFRMVYEIPVSRPDHPMCQSPADHRNCQISKGKLRRRKNTWRECAEECDRWSGAESPPMDVIRGSLLPILA